MSLPSTIQPAPDPTLPGAGVPETRPAFARWRPTDQLLTVTALTGAGLVAVASLLPWLSISGLGFNGWQLFEAMTHAHFGSLWFSLGGQETDLPLFTGAATILAAVLAGSGALTIRNPGCTPIGRLGAIVAAVVTAAIAVTNVVSVTNLPESGGLFGGDPLDAGLGRSFDPGLGWGLVVLAIGGVLCLAIIPVALRGPSKRAA